MGAGGGILITAILSGFIPTTSLFPVQNIILLFSSLSRTFFYWQDINWKIAWPFILGLAMGCFAGAAIYVQLPEKTLSFLIAISMLLFTWGPGKGEWLTRFLGLRVLLGAIHGFISSVTGTGGLLQATFARIGLSKNPRIATFAVVISFSNVWRGIAYALFGASILPYWKLILIAIPIAFAGSWLGKKIGDLIPEKAFDILFKTIVTLFALRLLYKALF